MLRELFFSLTPFTPSLREKKNTFNCKYNKNKITIFVSGFFKEDIAQLFIDVSKYYFTEQFL